MHNLINAFYDAYAFVSCWNFKEIASLTNEIIISFIFSFRLKNFNKNL